MSMNREQFEAWYLENWGHTEDNHESLFERCQDGCGDEYYRLGVRMAYEAWQAAFKASEQQLTESRREFTAANATIHNLELKVEQVVAENAALRKFPDQIIGFVGKLGTSEIGADTKEKIQLAASRVKTPATDAFLAEVRAQVWIEAKVLAKSAVASDSIDHIDFLFDGKAAQLRQGAEHE